jgi:hypothetical protein
MKKSDMVLSVLLIVFGILIIIVPQFLLPVCSGTLVTEAGKEVPMKCHWMAQSEILTGLAVAVAGVLSLVIKKAGGRTACGIFAAFGGLLALLSVTAVIGVCSGPTMACVIGTRPAIIILSVLTMLVGAIVAFKAGELQNKMTEKKTDYFIAGAQQPEEPVEQDGRPRCAGHAAGGCAFGGSMLGEQHTARHEHMSGRFGADMMVVPRGSDASAEGLLLRSEPSEFYLNEDLTEEIAGMDGVKVASPQLFIQSLDAACCTVPVQLIGYEPETDFNIQPWIIARWTDSLGMARL